MAIRGTSVRNTVFRAFYTRQSAMVQAQAMMLGGGKPGLTAREASDAATTNEGESLYVIV